MTTRQMLRSTAFFAGVLAVIGLIVACRSSQISDAGVQRTTVLSTTSESGRFVINPQFDEADQFSDGLAAVRIGDDKTGKWGYISR